MGDPLADLRALLPEHRLQYAAVLGGSDRSEVRRLFTDAGTLVAKTFPTSDEGWVRECAALSVMPPAAPAPRLVAAGAAPAIVVMTDLGTGPSVADALGTDPTAATETIVRWAETLAALHAATAGVREAFRTALALRAGGSPVAESTVPAVLDDAARAMRRFCAELGVAAPPAAWVELRQLGRRLSPDGPAALTPADACPDNNARVGDGLKLVDFEEAQWRHIAWDVAYLVVPWPSCWCSWRIPDEVAERAIEAYRRALHWPYVHTAEFRRDVAAAAVGWAVVSTTWFLPRALGDDASLGGPGQPTPTRRAMILHCLAAVRAQAELPALAELAGGLHHELVRRWGSTPLGLAPAFRP